MKADTRISAPLVGVAWAGLLLQLLVIPVWLVPGVPGWAWLLVPLTLLTTPFWSLIHEAIHGSLFPSRRWNDRAGRVLAIGYGAPFALLKAGHLLHHQYSRTRRERTEIYDPSRTTWRAAAPGYYFLLLGGLYLAEVLSMVLALAPARVWRYLGRRLDSPETVTGLLIDRVQRRQLQQFRIDALVIVLVYGASAWAYGRHVWMLILAVAGRALLISVADNAYHYGTRLEASLEAMNLWLPRPLEAFVLAFNLHSVHHRHPGLPWHELRAAFSADADRFQLGWFAAAGRQLSGPIPETHPEVAPLSARQAELHH